MTTALSAGARKPAPAGKPKRRRARYSAAPLVGEIDESSLGPAMRALTEKQRRFVLELATFPATGYGAAVRAAKAAGFGTPTSTDNAMKVTAHRLMHTPKVQDALREVGYKNIRAEAFEAIRTTAAIARNPKHKDCLKANLALMDRGGFGIETVHHVEVAHSHRHSVEATPAVLERIGGARAAGRAQSRSTPADHRRHGRGDCRRDVA
jgi:phage terminase small subunit